jgi:tripartite-type tricarboxylate transporter receptor subunit TctC
MNAIGVTGSKRYFALSEVPTLKEQGLKEMDLYTWIGLFIPISTPDSIQKKIRQDMDKICSIRNFWISLVTGI